MAPRHGHVFYIDVPRPTDGLHVQFDYTAVDLRRVTPLDYFAGSPVLTRR
ncbi:hypothetical protein [Kibdelosporangium aridum]|nr:hypothetical protein [Kibdelosporangium aridum]